MTSRLITDQRNLQDLTQLVSSFLQASGLAGATANSRYVGGTTSGSPGSGTFLVGDFVVTQDGNVYICTTAGSPGTWTNASSGASTSFGTPALTLSTTNAAGAATTAMRTDATVAAFDATAPVTQAFADTAAAGSAGVAARRDHKHGMPAAPSVAGTILASLFYNPAQTSRTTNSNTYVLVDSNLTITFTAPASGNVIFKLSASANGASGVAGLLWTVGPHGGSAVSTAEQAISFASTAALATAYIQITGLTPGNSYTYDWFQRSGATTNVSTLFGTSAGTNNQYGPAVMLVQAL